MMAYALRRRLTNHLMTLLMVGAALAVMAPLGIIFVHILKMGASSLSLDFFTQIPKPTGESGGGMANGLAGSALMIALASGFGLPIGILGAVYLTEFGSPASPRPSGSAPTFWRESPPSSPAWLPTPCWWCR